MKSTTLLSAFAAASLVVLPLAGATATTPSGTQPPAAEPTHPPARVIPGITAQDVFTGGCVDCHLNRPDIGVDARFGPALARAHASGKHPDVTAALSDIPRSCLTCHGKGSTAAPEFARIVHRIHLTGGERNHFLTLFQGECTHCHKLDAATGALSLPSGPEK